MITKVLLTVLLFLPGLNTVTGQTAEGIETKYGKPENVYSVSEHIWMTPTYNADGQVCMMRLYPKLISSDTNYLDAKFEIDEVLKALNQVVPVDMRGRRRGLFGISDVSGGIVWTHFNFDRVAFTFISAFGLNELHRPDSDAEAGSLTGIGFDFSNVDEAALAEAKRLEAMRSDEELIRETTMVPKVIEVRWSDRKCGGE